MEEDNRSAENHEQIKLLQQILLEKTNGWGQKVLLGREETGELSFSGSDVGLGLLPMKSMHLTAQASRNRAVVAALMELRSQDSSVREPFPVPAQGKACKPLRSSKGSSSASSHSSAPSGEGDKQEALVREHPLLSPNPPNRETQ